MSNSQKKESEKLNEFKELGLSDITVDALTKKGFVKPTPIQAKTIPVLLKGELDVIGQAQTGTGKTACFVLPILENLEETKKVQALILAPTRELAIQVAKEAKSLAGKRKVKVTAIYGGASIGAQIDELKSGTQIVVGTPGRVMDLIKREKLNIRNITYAVLDEADEMLNMGFVDDIEKILKQTNKDKKMLLFSATMPKEIQRIAKKFMREHELIKVKDENLATELIDQVYFDIPGRERYSAVKKIVGVTPNFHGLIFCKTRAEVDTVAKKLAKDNYSAAALHGDIAQSQREHILMQFREKKLKILIATDVAARGIDVNDLNVVINYSLPQSPETYVHRIGRTGRAGNKGTAITFLIPSEKNKLKFVERIIKEKIPKGKLPSMKEVIEAKKLQIEETIEKIIQTGDTNEYNEIAKRLVDGNDPEKVVASLLKHTFTNELDYNTYKDNRTSDDRPSRSGSRDRRSSRSSRDSRSRDRKSQDRRSGDRQKDSKDRRRSSDRQRSFNKREPRSDNRQDRRSSDRSRSDRPPRKDYDRSSRSQKRNSDNRERSLRPQRSGEEINWKKKSKSIYSEKKYSDKKRSSKKEGDFKRRSSSERKSYDKVNKSKKSFDKKDKPKKDFKSKTKKRNSNKEVARKGRRPLKINRMRN